MGRKRDTIPPFEIMGHTPRSGSSAPSGGAVGAPSTVAGSEENRPQETRTDHERLTPAHVPWWVGASTPLRVPRGVAVGIGLAMLLLLIMAYWVGYSRGAGNLESRIAARVEAELASGRTRRAPPLPGSLSAEGPATMGDESGGDPRVAGLNYLVVARYPPAEAERLAAFLAGHGVETYREIEQNGRFARVTALPGFSGADYAGEPGQAFMSRMQELGRAWRRSNGGRGDALESMYFRRQP